MPRANGPKVGVPHVCTRSVRCAASAQSLLLELLSSSTRCGADVLVSVHVAVQKRRSSDPEKRETYANLARSSDCWCSIGGRKSCTWLDIAITAGPRQRKSLRTKTNGAAKLVPERNLFGRIQNEDEGMR